MRSFIGLPNTHMAGDIFVVGSVVFLYWRIAFWNASMLTAPSLPTLPVISLLMVLTPTLALQLLCGKATELRQWWTPHWHRNSLVEWATNSGPPSDKSSSGMPYVAKVWRSVLISPWAPLSSLSTIGQLE